MPRLLHIEASPRKARSSSTEVAKAFTAELTASAENVFVDVLDLWAKPLMEFDQAALDAKYAAMHGQAMSSPQKTAWAELEKIADRFKAADIIVISTPMWNFSIPYKLKHYLDLLMQPGMTFGHVAERGYFGLVHNKQAVLIYSSAGDYPAGTPAAELDFQSRYLNFALKFIGVSAQNEIRVAPSASANFPALKQSALSTAQALARQLATQLAQKEHE